MFGFNLKKKNKQDDIEEKENPEQILLDFYHDWFENKYTPLMNSEYLTKLKFVKDYTHPADIMEQIEIFDLQEDVTTKEEMLRLTNIDFPLIVSLQSAMILLARVILTNPMMLVDPEFTNYYQNIMPKYIESERMLSEFGKQHNYPLLRINAVAQSIRYMPNLTIGANEFATRTEHSKIEKIDLSFYDRYETIRDNLYDATFKLAKRFYDEENKAIFNKTLSVVDDLLTITDTPQTPYEETKEKDAQ